MLACQFFSKGKVMKKFCLALLFFGLLAYLYHYLTQSVSLDPVYLSTTSKLSQEKPNLSHEVYGYIDKINNNNSKIISIFAEDITIQLKQNATIVVHGRLAMQKSNLFRLNVWHDIFGQEMDIGSNNDIFWFWSKRMNKSTLYYSKHEDLNKTLLKTPLNPAWLIESMNLNTIDIKNIEVAKFKNFWAIIQQRISALGENVTIVTLIDPKKTAVIGRYLYNQQGKLVASTEVQEFSIDQKTNILIPKKLYIIWYSEGITMEWQLNNPKINVIIPNNLWLIPNMKNKINIGQ